MPEVAVPQVPDAGEIEKIVLAVLKKHVSQNDISPMLQTLPYEEQSYLLQELLLKEPEDSDDELKALLGDGGFSAIANTLASFHAK